MSDERVDQERPCLHCMMVELIDDFFTEYPVATGEVDTIDPDEVVTAIAKTVAEPDLRPGRYSPPAID